MGGANEGKGLDSGGAGSELAMPCPESLPGALLLRGFTKEAARAALMGASVFEFSGKLPCPKAKARVKNVIEQIVPRMTEAIGGVYSSI